jgi:hypothetical protein
VQPSNEQRVICTQQSCTWPAATTVIDVPKKWLVYPFTKKDVDGGAALQRLFQVVDPNEPDIVVTLRVSRRDGEEAYYEMLKPDTPVPFEWQFEDPTEMIYRRPLKPLPLLGAEPVGDG